MMTDLICISHLRWDFVWQRPQHLLSRLAQQYRLLFVEEPVTTTDEQEPRLEVFPGQKASNVTVVRLVQPVEAHHWIGHGDPLTQKSYTRLLLDYLQAEGYNQPLLWLYTPMAFEFVEAIQPQLLIYDVMDELSAFKGAPVELRERGEALLRQADIVFTGGLSLYRSRLPYNSHTYLFPSGVEIHHFAQAAQRDAFPRPDDLQEVSGPILGYFGVIDERMDLPLLAHMAEAHPEWHLVMIGPVIKIDPAELPRAPNLHYLGMKDYHQLPAYLAHFDVALVPFAMNEATRYLSPTKTLEYMAAHKPVVSAPIHDVVELYGEYVQIGKTPEEFVTLTEAALAETEQERAVRQAKETDLLARYTWDSIADHMNQIIEQNLVQKMMPAIASTQ
jgi:glycosyltransferase involved in cell wall biosynthesis